MKIDLLIDHLTSLKTTKLDDFVDRLHYLFTTLLLGFFVFLVGMQQTFNSPLSCKVEANWPGSWDSFATDYCYTIGTYHTNDGNDYKYKNEKVYVNYYQWVPYALAIQALSFYLPHFFYLILSAFALPGLNLQSILDRCHEASKKKEEEMSDEATEIAKSIYAYAELPSKKSMKSLGSSFAYSYLLSKALNLANVALNIYFLNQFIGFGNSNWAFTIVQKAYENLTWKETGFFPRITFCDLPFKGVGQGRTHTVQCLLMINILTEKAYVVIYFWFLALFVMTFVDLCWAAFTLLARPRAPISSFAKPSFKGDYKTYLEFCGQFMSKNGTLLVRFVNEHAGSVTAYKLVESLATLWKKKELLGNEY